MFETRKIRFAMIKLARQAGQYWENFERIMRYKRKSSGTLGGHEREASVEVRYTIFQSTITG